VTTLCVSDGPTLLVSSNNFPTAAVGQRKGGGGSMMVESRDIGLQNGGAFGGPRAPRVP